jgi:hypothetical protein
MTSVMMIDYTAKFMSEVSAGSVICSRPTATCEVLAIASSSSKSAGEARLHLLFGIFDGRTITPVGFVRRTTAVKDALQRVRRASRIEINSDLNAPQITNVGESLGHVRIRVEKQQSSSALLLEGCLTQR